MKPFKIFLVVSVGLHLLLLLINAAPSVYEPQITPIEIVRQDLPKPQEALEPLPEPIPEPEPAPEPTPEPPPVTDVPVLDVERPNLDGIDNVDSIDPSTGTSEDPEGLPSTGTSEIVPITPDLDNLPPPMTLDEFLSERSRQESLIDRPIPEILEEFIEENPLPEGEEALSMNQMSLRYDSYFYAFSRALYGVWKYPEGSARRGESGIVRVAFSITKDGKITNINMLESSGYPDLDREVMRTLRNMPDVPLPQSSELETMHINGYFIYSLDGRYRVY